MVRDVHRLLFVFALSVLVAGCEPGAFTPANQVAGSALRAKLVGGSGGEGTVDVHQEGDHLELKVEINGGQPVATFELVIDGQVVALLTLDEWGNGHFEFDTDPDEPEEAYLPEEFEGADEGQEVEVGDMNGTFEEHDEGEADDSEADDSDDHSEDSDEGEADDHEERDTEGSADDDAAHEDDSDGGESDDDGDGEADQADDGETDALDDDEADQPDEGESDNSSDDVEDDGRE